jgi:oligoendopeptidase F
MIFMMPGKKNRFQQTRWSLDDLFSTNDPAALDAAFLELEEKSTAFESNRSVLVNDIQSQEFLDVVRQLEEINRLAHKVQGFSELYFAEDTQNTEAQNLSARVMQFLAGISNRTLFFDLWWKQLPDAIAAQLMAGSGDYHYFLEQMRYFKKHTLSEPEEIIINLKDVSGSRALNLLYSSITNRYVFNLEIEGQQKQLTRGELMIHVRHHSPELRESAYSELHRVYAQDASILGQIYQSLVRDWYNEQVTLRKFSNPLAPRNLANDIPDPIVDTLLSVCRSNAGLFQRFFNLKARWLGMERLRRCDLYAPVAVSDKRYTYSQAARKVLDSFSQFDPQLAQLAQRVFDRQHLDSEVRPGKRSGAFCLTAVPNLTPWVLLNFQGKAEDVTTMAHELGHAIHSMLAENHSIFTFHASLPLAETASTFGEMMLVDRLLQQESNEALRRDLLFRQVDDAYATIQRQAFFALFEKEAHAMIQQNAGVFDLADAYLDNLHQQFGDSVEISDIFRWEWISIPHLYNVPFYVYAYAFGQLLVLSLYKQYRMQGEAFKPHYLKILSSGGAEAPIKLLADAAIDIRQESFWQGGFVVISGLINQLEALPVQNIKL